MCWILICATIAPRLNSMRAMVLVLLLSGVGCGGSGARAELACSPPVRATGLASPSAERVWAPSLDGVWRFSALGTTRVLINGTVAMRWDPRDYGDDFVDAAIAGWATEIEATGFRFLFPVVLEDGALVAVTPISRVYLANLGDGESGLVWHGRAGLVVSGERVLCERDLTDAERELLNSSTNARPEWFASAPFLGSVRY